LDKLVLARILNESLQGLDVKFDLLQEEIFLMYRLLGSITVTDLLQSRDSITFVDFRRRIEGYFPEVLKATDLADGDDLASEFVDPQFIAFFRKIVEGRQRNPARSNGGGYILPGLRQFVEFSMEYMGEAYQHVDELIATDFISLLYKHFANLVGVYIAICSSASSNGEDRRLAVFTEELSDSKILWEKK
jgi:hypothetical protein